MCQEAVSSRVWLVTAKMLQHVVLVLCAFLWCSAALLQRQIPYALIVLSVFEGVENEL